MAVALAGVAVALFPDAFLRGGVFYYRDIHLQWVGQMEVLLRSLNAGSWPLWNPYASFGQPLLANPNYEVYYPLTPLGLFMAPWTYYRLFVFFHLVLGGGGTYAAGRRLGLSPVAAGLGAVTWMASGPFVSLVSLWNHLAAAAWIPWSAWAGHRAASTGSAGAVIVWAATLAAPILAGSPEMALFAGVFGLVFALGPALRSGGAWRAGKAAALAGLFALAFSAAQWMPTLELAFRSQRADLSATQREFWSVPVAGLAQCFVPAVLDALPLRRDVRAVLYESREPFLRSLYLGLSAAALVAVALASGRRAALALAVLGFVLTGLALGRHAPLAALFEAVLPPLRSLRFPAKAMVPVSLCWALLAALGAQAWMSGGRPRLGPVARVASMVLAVIAVSAAGLVRIHAEEVGRLLIEPDFTTRSVTDVLAPVASNLTYAAVAALAMAILAWSRPRPALRGGVAALVVAVDVISVGSGLIPVSEAEIFKYRPPALRFLGPAPGVRVYSFDYFEPAVSERLLGHPGYLLKIPRDRWPVPWADAAALRASLYPSLLSHWGIQDGFRIDWLGLYPPHMTALVSLTRRSMLSPAFHRVLRVGAITHVVALHKEGLEDLVLVADVPSLFLEDVHVFKVPDALPPAYVVAGARVAGDVEAGRLLVDPAFDLSREVVLPVGKPNAPPASFDGDARIVEWQPNRVVVEARASAPGYLMLVEAYDPSWRATVDGAPAEVLRANIGFRAVALGPGPHRIVFTYRPRAAVIGLALSLAALAVGGAVLRRSRDPGAAPAPAYQG